VRAWPRWIALFLALFSIALTIARHMFFFEPHLALDLAQPSIHHVLGCGEGGVDILSYAGEAFFRSLLLSITVGALSMVLGFAIAAPITLRGGVGPSVLRWLCNVLQTLPSFLVALAILSAFKNTTTAHVGLVFLVTSWVPFARLTITEVITLRSTAFVEAAYCLGAGSRHVLTKHIAPNVFPLLRAQLGTTCSALLIAQAGLAFLGVGDVDSPSIGLLLDQGLGAMILAPHILVAASVVLFLASWSVQVLVDPISSDSVRSKKSTQPAAASPSARPPSRPPSRD
jgi:peptide/nickel transport system permease protein